MAYEDTGLSPGMANWRTCTGCGERYDTTRRIPVCPHDWIAGMETTTEKVDPLDPKVPDGHGSGDGRPVPGEKPVKPRRFVGSTSDARTVNNVMRHAYKVLTPEEKEQMQAVKDLGLEFHEFLKNISDKRKEAAKAQGKVIMTEFASRELSIAATKIEEAVMWAVKDLTK